MTGLADPEIVYDIQLHRPLPEALRSEFPAMKVHTTGAQTVLRLQVDDPRQLDALLEKLRSVGVHLTGLHRITEPEPETGRCAVYEVWVAGELGESLLRYLRCAHYVIPEQTQLRLTLGQAGLRRFLRACTRAGASIDRVRMVGSATRPSASA
jgi:hypothetical protein